MNIIVYLAYLLKKENCQKNSDIKFNDFFSCQFYPFVINLLFVIFSCHLGLFDLFIVRFTIFIVYFAIHFSCKSAP